MSKFMTKRIEVRLPGNLVRRARRQAAAECRSLTAVIEDGLHRVLNERVPTEAAARILPPVSEASGGSMPGIDPNETTALQGMGNLASISRTG